MTATTASAASGVQELIDRIRDDGVQAARKEAERILKQAREEAAATKAAATNEARAMVAAARTQIDTDRAAGEEAIRNAARDALLELQNQVRKAFAVHVRRLVSQQVQETEFVRSLILVLAGEAADKYIKDRDAVIFVSGDAEPDASQSAVNQKIQNAVLGAVGSMLREGVDLMPDEHIKGGARVRLVGQELEIDMTDEALARMLLKNLMPRYRAIVQEDVGE